MGLFIFVAFALFLFFGVLTLLSRVSAKKTRQKPKAPASPSLPQTASGNSPVTRPLDPYQVLGVAEDASEAQIRQAYSARLSDLRRALSTGQKPDSAVLDGLREAFRRLSKAAECQIRNEHQPAEKTTTNGNSSLGHQTGGSFEPTQHSPIGGLRPFVIAAMLYFPFALANAVLMRWCILPLTNSVIGLVPFDQWLKWAELPIVGVFTALPLLAIGIGVVGFFILLACVSSFTILVASAGIARNWRAAVRLVDAYPKAKEFAWVGALLFLVLAFIPFYVDLVRHALPLPKSTEPMDILFLASAIALLEGYVFPPYFWAKILPGTGAHTSTSNKLSKVPLTPVSELMHIIGTPLAALSLLALAGYFAPWEIQEDDGNSGAQTPHFTRLALPALEVDQSRLLFWMNEDEILFYPKNSLLESKARILNIKTQEIRSSDENVWYLGCRGGDQVYQASSYSTVENNKTLRDLQGSECAVAMYPPTHDQSTSWASFSLLAKDGYVMLPSADGDAELHKPEGTSVVLHGLNAAQLYGVNQHVVFYPHQNAYLLHNTHPKQLFWLYPDGRLETVSIKPLDRPGNTMIFATRNGFIQHHDWRFVLLGRKPLDIERQPVWHVAVSPDGCKVAYNITENPQVHSTVLRAINVCQ